MLVLVRFLFRSISGQGRRRSAAHHRRAAIREGEVPRGPVELGFRVPLDAKWSGEHDGALGPRRDLAVDEISGGQVAPLLLGHWHVGFVDPWGPSVTLFLSPCLI